MRKNKDRYPLDRYKCDARSQKGTILKENNKDLPFLVILQVLRHYSHTRRQRSSNGGLTYLPEIEFVKIMQCETS